MDGPSYREEGACIRCPVTLESDFNNDTLFYLIFNRDFLAHLFFLTDFNS